MLIHAQNLLVKYTHLSQNLLARVERVPGAPGGVDAGGDDGGGHGGRDRLRGHGHVVVTDGVAGAGGQIDARGHDGVGPEDGGVGGAVRVVGAVLGRDVCGLLLGQELVGDDLLLEGGRVGQGGELGGLDVEELLAGLRLREGGRERREGGDEDGLRGLAERKMPVQVFRRLLCYDASYDASPLYPTCFLDHTSPYRNVKYEIKRCELLDDFFSPAQNCESGEALF